MKGWLIRRGRGFLVLLSVGFIAAALLTVLGFFLYALFSLRKRTIEIGILQAVGLSVLAMIRLVAWEIALLILSGIGLGTTLGLLMSRLFVPFFQIGAEVADRTPPYLVEIAWPAIVQIYVLFVCSFWWRWRHCPACCCG